MPGTKRVGSEMVLAGLMYSRPDLKPRDDTWLCDEGLSSRERAKILREDLESRQEMSRRQEISIGYTAWCLREIMGSDWCADFIAKLPPDKCVVEPISNPKSLPEEFDAGLHHPEVLQDTMEVLFQLGDEMQTLSESERSVMLRLSALVSHAFEAYGSAGMNGIGLGWCCSFALETYFERISDPLKRAGGVAFLIPFLLAGYKISSLRCPDRDKRGERLLESFQDRGRKLHAFHEPPDYGRHKQLVSELISSKGLSRTRACELISERLSGPSARTLLLHTKDLKKKRTK